MSIQELVVRFQDNIWQVRRGARSKILVVDVDGSSIEFPVIEPQGRPAADVA